MYTYYVCIKISTIFGLLILSCLPVKLNLTMRLNCTREKRGKKSERTKHHNTDIQKIKTISWLAKLLVPTVS